MNVLQEGTHRYAPFWLTAGLTVTVVGMFALTFIGLLTVIGWLT